MTFERKLLKDWLVLEEKRTKVLEAAEKNHAEVASSVIEYLSAASSFKYQEIIWYKTIQDYETALQANFPIHSFALLKSREKHERMPWEYEGRTWYYWLHIFSKNYGWSEEQIAKLDIDTAIGLLQEILITGQEEREWEWALTEIAYPYNPRSKKSEFRELPRPDWMKKIVPKPKKVRMRANMFPQGLIVGKEQE